MLIGSVGSWFENFVGGYYPRFRTDPRSLPSFVVDKYLRSYSAFFYSVLNALENQPDNYDPACPDQGMVLPALFEAVQGNLPRGLRPFLRCYQAVDSYLDLFHHTDYLFVLGGFLGHGDLFVRLDVTAYQQNGFGEGVRSRHMIITPADVIAGLSPGESIPPGEMPVVDQHKVEIQGKKIARMLLAQYKQQENSWKRRTFP